MVKTTARGADLEPIDRLEEKVRLLVAMMARMREEQTRVTEENLRLARDVEGLRSRLAETDGIRAELSSMREERDVVRTRVSEMLEQLEGLNL